MAVFQSPNPSSIRLANQARSILTVYNILDRSFSRKFTDRFGPQNYMDLIQTLGKIRKVDNRDYYHHESYGKLHWAVQVASLDVNGGVGGTSTITINTNGTYNGGAQSPLRIGEVIAIPSSNIEGKILTTPSVTQFTVAPLKSTQAFAPAVGQWLESRGPSEVGEKSDAVDPISNPTTKISNSTTEIRDDYRVSDRAMVERLEFDYKGQPYIQYKDIDEMERRFGNYREFKLIKGDVLTNTTANATSVGTQGLISMMTARAATLQYGVGAFDIAKFHEINREIFFNGSMSAFDWLMDVYAFQEIQDVLFDAYPNGAIQWAEGSDQAIMALYGFSGILIDGVRHNLKVYKPFSPEITHGIREVSANSPIFRNYSLILPNGEAKDPKTQELNFSVQLTYQELKGQFVHTWETGALSDGGGQTPVLEKRVHMACLCGIEGFGLNQGLILDGA